jgi:hypothetical protein
MPWTKTSIKEIRLSPNSKYYNTKELTITFPVVVTNNPQIDKLINTQIKDEMFYPDNIKQSLKAVLDENVNDGLINLSYQITYNNDGLLSFSISAEGCGAHCSSWDTYFNFYLLSGMKVSISDVFLSDKIDSFKKIVQFEKKNSLAKYRLEEKTLFNNNEIDSSTYDWAIAQVDENCINQVSIESFSFSNNLIEIFDPCEFPHVIRSQEPIIELKYTYNSIKEFLTPKFRKLLMK